MFVNKPPANDSTVPHVDPPSPPVLHSAGVEAAAGRGRLLSPISPPNTEEAGMTDQNGVHSQCRYCSLNAAERHGQQCDKSLIQCYVIQCCLFEFSSCIRSGLLFSWSLWVDCYGCCGVFHRDLQRWQKVACARVRHACQQCHRCVLCRGETLQLLSEMLDDVFWVRPYGVH